MPYFLSEQTHRAGFLNFIRLYQCELFETTGLAPEVI